MTIKQKAKELYSAGMNISEIAIELKTHRSYIYQIVTNRSNIGRKGREDKYIGFDKCERCGGKAQHLHHKDLNNANDDKANLEAVCIPCHQKIHAEERQRALLKFMDALSDEKRVEIMSYYYEYTRNGKPGLGSGVLSKFDLTEKQFELIKQWYDDKYGVPKFKRKRSIGHIFPDNVEFVS